MSDNEVLQKKRFVFFTLWDFFLFHFRLPLMQAVLQHGGEVFAVSPPGEFAQRFAREGMTFIPLEVDRRTFNPIRGWHTVQQLRTILEQIRPHLLHSFAHRPNGYAGLALRGLTSPPVFVATVTGLGTLYVHDDLKTRIRRWMMEFTLQQSFRQASTVVFQNTTDMQEFVQKGICAPEQARVIPGSGVDASFFRPHLFSLKQRRELRQQMGLDPDMPVVLMVSRLIRDKGILEFLEVARRLRPKAQFVLVGGPDPGNPHPLFWAEVQEQAKQAGVLLPGFQEDVRTWYAISDIFVLPSYREGLPKTLLEAMAMGLPVVASDVPGCRDAVVDRQSGLLVPPRNVDALSHAITRLLNDEPLRRRLGEQARLRVLGHFEVNKITKQYLVLYHHLLQKQEAHP